MFRYPNFRNGNNPGGQVTQKKKMVRHQKWEVVPNPNTRKHAERLLAERLADIHRGSYFEPRKVTFAEFTTLWVKNYAEQQVRPNTLALYSMFFNIHILPVFGNLQLSRIRVEAIEKFKTEKLRSGLSPQTVKHLTRLIRQMLNHAIDWEYLKRNPAARVKDPKVPQTEMDCLSPEEAKHFLSFVDAEWFPFFLLAISTGLRIGELLAMKWANLDPDSGRYFVKETMTRKGEFSPTKTTGSAKPVNVIPSCISALREHRARQSELRLKTGASYLDLDLIFASSKGTPLSDRNIVNRIFHPILKRAGLRRIRFHDLRHTTASLLISQGENPKYIQSQMRHASIQTTFDRYGHLFSETHKEAVARLDATLSTSEQ